MSLTVLFNIYVAGTVAEAVTFQAARLRRISPVAIQTLIYENSTGLYIAKGATYATTNSSVWQLRFIDQTTDEMIIKYANGRLDFDQIADDYLTLTYQ